MLVVIVANYPEVFFAEAFIAVTAMTIAILIVVIPPMLPAMIFVVIARLNGLRRQNHPSCYCEKY